MMTPQPQILEVSLQKELTRNQMDDIEFETVKIYHFLLQRQNYQCIAQQLFQMFKFGLYWLSSLSSAILIPIYICLAPLCMISSTLFDWTMSWIIDDQTISLFIILILEWAVSALLIFQLMIDRAGKSIFFYEFIFFIVCSNFIMIGITYSLLHRSNIIEQFAAKVCTTLLLVLSAQKMKMNFKQTNQICVICFQKMTQECIILKCSHYFHEKCLWEWAYVKPECPSCKKAIN